IAGGGCRFGFDPRDPTGRSSEANGLCPQLEARGLALPLLGGVTHQTVAGYLATGSSGGSLRWSLNDAVRSLRLVDGRGEVREIRRGDPLFAAAGVSLGLLGVVTEVTFECEPRFDVIGEERVTAAANAEFD